MKKYTHFEEMQIICENLGNAGRNEHPLMYPEYLASKEINEIFANSNPITLASIERIVQILIDIEKTKHFDGSAWLDYKLHVDGMFWMKGVRSEIIDEIRAKLNS